MYCIAISNSFYFVHLIYIHLYKQFYEKQLIIKTN